ncbi:unnamed protein product [Bursaphelenchus xylophilus]|uniref:(pine wood nematode) hypothetical protein n=1 Tax=Bursaphelenchus xylophilus TaxID=6326 RepID=A0A7I8XEL3_BURXY|nr:unnamed protein product [Bursaphelenchus xylophilus]CAG9080238.1 unnamed protein product [Bursaphelenchus xylophilus]
MIDNTFLQFAYHDPQTTSLPSTATTPVALVSYSAIVAIAVATVMSSIAVGLAIFGIIFYVKYRGFISCDEKKSAPAEQPYVLYPEYSMKEKTESVKEKKVAEKVEEKKEKVEVGGDGDCAEDSLGNVDENMKTYNPMDNMPVDSLEGVKLVDDPEFDGAVPELGQGGFGAVYKYRVGYIGDEFVAVKFVKASNGKELRRAKREFMKTRRMEMLLEGKEDLIASIVAMGRNPSTLYMIFPFYYRNMSVVLKTKLQLQQKLNIIYHLLRPILQLQQLTYAHLDVKPDNYMQKSQYRNTIILCNFGLAKRFGAVRGADGSPDFMSAPCHRREPTSMVDDMQSWLIMVVLILLNELPWMSVNDSQKVKKFGVKEALFGGQVALKEKLDMKNAFFEKVRRTSDPHLIICDLAEMIWNKDRTNKIYMDDVLTYLDELQETYKFTYKDYWFENKKPYERVFLIPTDDDTQESSPTKKTPGWNGYQ